MGQREVLKQWEHRKYVCLWYKLRLLTFWLLAVVLPKIEKPAQARQANLWSLSNFLRSQVIVPFTSFSISSFRYHSPDDQI
jgi:hypothetical protein